MFALFTSTTIFYAAGISGGIGCLVCLILSALDFRSAESRKRAIWELVAALTFLGESGFGVWGLNLSVRESNQQYADMSNKWVQATNALALESNRVDRADPLKHPITRAVAVVNFTITNAQQMPDLQANGGFLELTQAGIHREIGLRCTWVGPRYFPFHPEIYSATFTMPSEETLGMGDRTAEEWLKWINSWAVRIHTARPYETDSASTAEISEGDLSVIFNDIGMKKFKILRQRAFPALDRGVLEFHGFEPSTTNNPPSIR